ncbi:uncharacterized protein PADG_11988 [Paracoccidioides brasiliensis Pb18]|uniref:Uncharacterized protein n=1 Tax=Paracoccidioides brasiliensis (strain Pb18) TaxID=502780 RepID=A0A0A0HUZ7_PARBD|nr:uncharacterized protein PADG_11988 [Paracoccidioides brasiliensis Pb18]KGM91851.1 hypothetical protein PADG_11988 [Paracoccidioides brasiliensis Pb18]
MSSGILACCVKRTEAVHLRGNPTCFWLFGRVVPVSNRLKISRHPLGGLLGVGQSHSSRRAIERAADRCLQSLLLSPLVTKSPSESTLELIVAWDTGIFVNAGASYNPVRKKIFELSDRRSGAGRES